MGPASIPRVARRYVLEGGPFCVLWLPGATLEQLQGWAAQVWPGALRELPLRRDLDALYVTSTDVLGEVRLEGSRYLTLFFREDVGPFLHELARRAADAGQPALVEQGEVFRTEAPYLAMTAYFPGKPAELRFFDPLRPEVANRPIPAAWLLRFVGYDGLVERYALEDRDARGTRLSWLELSRGGTLSPQPLWLSDEAVNARLLSRRPAPERPPSRLPEQAADGLAWLSGLLTLLLLGPLSVAVPAVAGSIIGASPVAAGSSVLLVGWLAFLPLKWPSGRDIRWPWKLAWFVLMPIGVSVAMGVK